MSFAVVRFGMRILKSGNRNVVIESLHRMGVILSSVSLSRRIAKFKGKLSFCENVLCMSLFSD